MTHEHTRSRTRGYTNIISCLFALLFAWFSVAGEAEAANLTFVSDTISTSVPGASANHIIKFTVTNTIPASGKIIVTPQAGAFTMPAGLNYTDIDFSDDGANQILSMSPGSGNGGAIGVSVTAGTSGNITFTLNNADALAAGSVITIKISNQQIQNPATAGSYKINIKTYDNSNTLIDQADAMAVILSPVQIGAPLKALATLSAIFSPAAATTTTLVNPDGTKFSIDFPQGFLDFLDDIRLQISSYQKEDFSPTASPPSGKSAVGKVYDIKIFRVLDGSAISSFSKNLILNFFYSDSDISGIDESTLRPYYWDGSQWVLVSGSAVFPGENKVTVSVNHFTAFVLMGVPPVEAAPAAEAPTLVKDGGMIMGITPVVTEVKPPLSLEQIINEIKQKIILLIQQIIILVNNQINILREQIQQLTAPPAPPIKTIPSAEVKIVPEELKIMPQPEVKSVEPEGERPIEQIKKPIIAPRVLFAISVLIVILTLFVLVK